MKDIKNVEFILSQYNNILADYDKAYTEYLKLQKQKELHKTGNIESDSEIINGMSLNAPILSHIPRSVTNKFSSLTENVALNYLKFILPSEKEINEVEKVINENKKILTNSFEKLKLIEHMISQLNEHETFIIENIYIHGYSMNKVLNMFNKAFPEDYVSSYQAIRRKKFDALYKMVKRLKAP